MLKTWEKVFLKCYSQHTAETSKNRLFNLENKQNHRLINRIAKIFKISLADPNSQILSFVIVPVNSLLYIPVIHDAW